MPPFPVLARPVAKRSLTACAALALLAAGAAWAASPLPSPRHPATQAQAGDAALTYSIHVGGMHVLDAQAHMGIVDEIYRVGLALETQGFLGRVASWKTDVRAQGSLAADIPQPARFTAHGAWREELRMTTLDYQPDGMPQITLAEPVPEKDREPVPEELRKDTLDPVSAIVAVLDQVQRTGNCDLTVPVYDGRQRYDLEFADKGRETLAASNLSAFAGEAQRCAVTYKPVAGRWKEQNNRRDRDGDGRRNSGRDVSLWIAPAAPGQPMVPVRLEMASPLGPVMVHLAKLDRVR
ncbi:DUF3108 domain-containing protein [Niveispirillum irakense]|uniref:DUF3108 domain-containing protein n=1 Tax=Niveispirillum irakense TaxID=34011 RepID=UPI000425AF50|nr:DUF3108 domain-containing protein [Niveispirillum irakense]